MENVTYYLTTPCASSIRVAHKRHGLELAQETAQLMRHQAEHTAQAFLLFTSSGSGIGIGRRSRSMIPISNRSQKK
jgi:hypothetical protein